ncbi:aminotransferase class V-fold PLP-dependent enzyme [Nonomuraea sp. NPDC050556]|uniref:aminotransferase class V-fold PLP-dependent enzyme n=1 Tax=Nonomuraea sp. NPDC050556 TaxID=3364369 RepID=UPI0037A502FB
MNRRALLLAGSGLALGACTPAVEPVAQPKGFDPKDWASVRAQFALAPGFANFAAFVLASHPAPVRQAIARHREGLDADFEGYRGTDDAEISAAAARFLGGKEGQVALTDSTTMGLSLLYTGFRLEPGQDVLTTEHDFLATHEALRMLAARTGAAVRKVRLYDDPAKASVDRIVSAVKAGIRPRTRIVAITWVHSSTGVRLPVRAIADMIAEVNKDRDEKDRALLCVDGVHGFGAIADGVDDLGCDFLSSGTHKWLFGPRGTGILWARSWAPLDPVIASFSAEASEAWFSGSPTVAPSAALITPGGYKAFEHRWAMPDAFAFQEAIGKERIQQRTQDLATRLKNGLAGMTSLRLVTPVSPDLSAGLVCCSVAGTMAGNIMMTLRDKHKIIASVTPYREQYLRFGTSMVNTPEQVDQLIKALTTL